MDFVGADVVATGAAARVPARTANGFARCDTGGSTVVAVRAGAPSMRTAATAGRPFAVDDWPAATGGAPGGVVATVVGGGSGIVTGGAVTVAPAASKKARARCWRSSVEVRRVTNEIPWAEASVAVAAITESRTSARSMEDPGAPSAAQASLQTSMNARLTNCQNRRCDPN